MSKGKQKKVDATEMSLQKVYEMGNYFLVRKVAKQMLADKEQGSTIKSAKDWLSKVKVDPIALIVGFSTLLFVLIVTIIASRH